MSTPAPQPVPKRGIVKQVLSGDSVVIRGPPRKGAPPLEKTILFSNVLAPKLARRATASAADTRDEPWAWEAREFLRKKVIGESVLFVSEVSSNQREYGVLYLGKDIQSGENITESLVNEGLATVRRDGRAPEVARLVELEDAAKTAGKGKWGGNPSEHVRDIKWTIENPMAFVDKMGHKPIKAVIEHVRDGSTVHAFLLPDFYRITLMISGIRAPNIPRPDENKQPDASTSLAEEAKYFVECLLLNRDVDIVLESTNNNNLVGSILHEKGNIAVALLREGFARCVDWSIAHMKTGADKLRAAEKEAKEKRLRIWKDWTPTNTSPGKEYSGTVVEIINGDALMVKVPGQSLPKKIFLASIRPPREQRSADEKPEEKAPLPPGQRKPRPLYEVPYMFEAREFLRKKLIGKKVNIVEDYVQPAYQNFGEKVCCTVTIGGVNVAETLVSKGLATVLRYRQDDDQRSSHYDGLLAAETKAAKSGHGLHSKKEPPVHRVVDVSGDLAKAKQFLPFLQRAGRIDAIAEFITSRSRLRLYIPKDSRLITLLLAGISYNKTKQGQSPYNDGEPFTDEEATNFTREKCMQREVQISVESMDRVGNYIGWLWVENTNLSVALAEEGYAKVHSSAEYSDHHRALKAAEESAKARRIGVWKNYKEEDEQEVKEKKEEDRNVDRQVNQIRVVVTETTPELHFYAQAVDQGPKLEALMAKIRQEFTANPPLPGAYQPKKGDVCAAKFVDDEWYRAKVEKVEKGGNVSVLYMDYGNRETLSATRCAQLPSAFTPEKAYAVEYQLFGVTLPPDADYSEEARSTFRSDVLDRTLLLNVEVNGSIPLATLEDPTSKVDVGKALIEDGLLLAEKRKERRLAKLLTDYKNAQSEAAKNHLKIWEYGDITEDDAKEFGM
ncbi:staphylococcal nuclease domain-containing protein 1 [Frankliniella occidentalis]|uniref:Staphylococcal nuclease domain-containing protein 1 n=1 Tax=Frankliniella occidentalis TaxID=133901 RepID=A0A6J1RXX4_FRAOC|nr:staphylococcal nuclease domain-containing protein 1 [Frankliniella occidentalis]